MAEEFQESDVIFQENNGNEDKEHNFPGEMNSGELRNMISKSRTKKLKTKKNTSSSVPMNIPANFSGSNSWFPFVDSGDDGEMEPPHVTIGRRISGKMMAFSVCSGNGRTLKGRDLSEVRNSILRMTGFLET